MNTDIGSVTREKDGWLVRVRLQNGPVQEFRCATEAQARYFAAVLALQPRRPPRLRN
jgi:hypothetical protein